MSIRSILILVSLAANIFLVVNFQGATRKIQEARQMSLFEDNDMNKVRELAGRVRPGNGLNPQGVNQDLAMLQKIKSSVAEEINKTHSGRPDLHCPSASRGELDQMVRQMADYKAKLDILLEQNSKEDRAKEELVRKVEAEALKIKMELLSLCSR